MTARFHHHDLLRLFAEIARYSSFSTSASALNMTKGAISYQIKTLEADLGMILFQRTTRGVTLTGEGLKLLAICQTRYEEIETGIQSLKGISTRSLTVGVSTYFAARWLSPRLMSFMQSHPDVQLRIQPMIEFSEHEMQDVDLAIRWGNGKWSDGTVTPFMPMPPFPVGNVDVAGDVERLGIRTALTDLTLLHDREDSNAWSDWLDIANLPPQVRRDVLIVPDPNVRVQAVINGQGAALMDDLVSDELAAGKLHRLSITALPDYGYFLVQPHSAVSTGAVQAFADWIQGQS
ncbi:LysR family transcriptional regulator [Rhodobacteraceae bacterium B1Z28]|uniref:LysR family transcriptional regulator n=1 Tax=Ruegeria haliotis TaxID=2747601 RepID=A0ABX2PV95_9RHOB|nr:LysR substrate-binding domain-containing protein [Ruegeria haliotis]NVO58089.1 LysR family transcriptional regulator [Ruegeria haliotis]